VHGGCEQGRQLSDVIESIDAKDGFFDRGLAFGRDDAVGQLGVLVTDVRLGQVPVAGAAQVDELAVRVLPSVRVRRTLGGELLVDREVVVGLFVMRQCLVDQGRWQDGRSRSWPRECWESS
jgi:hypothetical protein